MPDVAEETRDVSVADLLNGDSNTSTETTNTETSTESSSEVLQEQGQGNVEGQQEEVSVPTLKDRVAELGFSDVESDEDAQQRLLEAFSQKTQTEQQYQQQLEMLRWQMQALMAQQSQQVPAQTQQTQQQNQSWWTPPQTNEQLRQQYIAGKADDGTVQWKPNTPPQLIQEYDAEQSFYADWAQKLVRNPKEALSGFKNEILNEARQQIQAELAQQSQQRQAESFMEQQIRENEDLLYQKDPVTKQIRRDFQGNALLTEAGVRMEGLLAQLEQTGVSSEIERWKLAQQLYKANYGDFKQAADQRMQAQRAAHLQKTVKPAGHVANRNGQEATQSNRMQRVSMGERFLAEHEISF